MTVARLNFSHGTYPDHAKLVKTVRQAAKIVKREVAILQDLQGPRIRIGDLSKDGVPAIRGTKIALVTDKFYASGKKVSGYVVVPQQYDGLYKDVGKGNMILIEDGKIRLKVESVEGQVIKCSSTTEGVIKNHKGINVPGVTLRAQVITEKDKSDLKFGIKQGVDFVAISFVKGPEDIIRLKGLIRKYAGSKKKENELPAVIAKIERDEAVTNFDAILEVVDGIMVARGDLGIELPAARVPILQKEFVAKCLAAAKPVIVATQMLDSMISSPIPTRAEVSDVANAVIDHTDAVMLSGESATGKYPVETVTVMEKIAIETENSVYDDLACGPYLIDSRAKALIQSACILREDLQAKAVVALTTTGHTARLMSRHRAEVPIVAFTSNLMTQRQMALSWGVQSYYLKSGKWDNYLKQVSQVLKKEKIVKKGDYIVIVASFPFDRAREPNLLKVHQIE